MGIGLLGLTPFIASWVYFRFSRLHVLFDGDELIDRYLNASSWSEKDGLRRAYSLMTGRSIDARVADTLD